MSILLGHFSACVSDVIEGELRAETAGGSWRRGDGPVLIMVAGISESERSAWKPSAADSSCMFEPSEDGDGAGHCRRC